MLAEKEFLKPVFRTIKNGDTKRRNCFNKPLYLVFEDGVLVVDRYSNFWTDTVLPATRFADVSHRFFGVVGAKIKSFEFKNNIEEKGENWRNQHITVIKMDSKRKLIFSNKHKEVEDTKISGFFDIIYD